MGFEVSETLALHGGPKAKRTPFPKGTRHGELEKKYLNEVIDSDMLFFYMGTKVRALEKRFAEMYGMKHCIACNSGTAAVHMAVAALELPVGSEVITSAITDMGSLTGILYQGLVPVPSLANDFSHPICKIAGVDHVSAISAALPPTS